MVTILTDTGDFRTADPTSVTATDAERITGWELKPEGMCRGDVCVKLPAGMATGGCIDLTAFWRHLGHPVLHDDARETWVLGTGADARNASLSQLEAPDFTLPDLAGVPHTLSALRGKKVFLATWASW